MTRIAHGTAAAGTPKPAKSFRATTGSGADRPHAR
jgi:hypothetical protein